MASPTAATTALAGAASCTGKRPATDSAESETTTRQRLSTEVPAESAPPAAAALADSTANPPTSSTGASSSDELIAAAPKLIAAIRVAGKCVKVAEKVASLLEEGRVKPFHEYYSIATPEGYTRGGDFVSTRRYTLIQPIILSLFSRFT